ncbi:AcvB/VirJ family lysyl-phosphatidylglycerol hydrolase [Phenylobacterium sp.]|uniref:AcvB/VirJ family lysyl-phosphatidylglycerol hydrolase n=1 Tax=Phenylobacterium sp. TaxID=1871053 RepID=UPI0025E4EB3F|nr:AcvB/VirJ family lysyl-phosphatidylglycerol hydrolase [Phenylobacterium sp.]MBX3482725.1 virulence factor family protein [Phenylobacterium sp.]
MNLIRTLIAGAAVAALTTATFAATRPPAPPAPPAPAPLAAAPANGPMTETGYRFGPAGPVTVYRTSKEPGRFVVFVSGDGGWNQGVVDMARQLARMDATVVGVDIRRYLAQTQAGAEAFYPAGDFAALAQAVQKDLGFTRYHRPVVVGYSSGATIAYGALAQAPAATFQGAIALGFCPDLKTPKPMSAGVGKLAHRPDPALGFVYAPSATLTAPFIVMQGGRDETCPAAQAHAFMAQVPRGRIVDLPKVGHGYSVPANWAPRLATAFASLYPAASAPAAPVASGSAARRLAGLPLVEVNAPGHGDTMAVLYSGDGGWAGIDQGLAAGLSRGGVPVVGYDALRYFWTARTSDEAARDLTAVLRRYMAAWGRSRVILAGYSFGADALPAIVARLPPDIRSHVRLVALVGVSKDGELEFRPGDWLNLTASSAYPLAPVLQGLRDVPKVCIYGDRERNDACPGFAPGLIQPIRVAGDHHFDGDYAPVSNAILRAAGI